MAILSFEAKVKYCDIVKWENANISAPGPQIKKLRTHSFLQLLKFEKAKYPYFFNLWLRGRDIGLLFERENAVIDHISTKQG